MGGAFVGLADDFSTIHWNPAGMAFFVQRQIGISGMDIVPGGSYRLDYPEPAINLIDAKTERKHYLGGLLAYFHPINGKLVAGLGIFTPSGLGTEWDGGDLSFLADGNRNIEWRSKIGIVTFAPGVAYRINDRLSLGMTLNINYGTFELARHAGTVENVGTQDLGQYTENSSGWGYGASFGILAKPFDFISAGLTVRTASTIRFQGEASISNLQAINLGAWPVNPTSELEREITWPVWIAAGVAVYPTPGLIVAADVHYTQWSQTKSVPYGSGDIDQGTGGYLKVDYQDEFWQMAVPALRALQWKVAVQLRFGIEYRIKALAVRCGYYWDPSPEPDRTMNIFLPSYDFNGFTAGLGYSFNGLRVDAGLEYLRGRARNIPLWKTLDNPPIWPDAMPGIHRMSIVAPTIGLSYSF